MARDATKGGPPKIYITAEDDEFDEETLREWRAEGFDVEYIPMNGGGKPYRDRMHSLTDSRKLGEMYAIVGKVDSFCSHIKPFPKLVALVAYYPTAIPDPKTRFTPSLQVCVHLADGQGEIGVCRNPEILGIQGKRKTVRKRITPGKGIGGTGVTDYPSYVYDNVDPGFAEHDLEEYNKVAARVAFTRSLTAVRKGFKSEVELEPILEDNIEKKYRARDPSKILSTMTSIPHVSHIPTLTGGVGREDLEDFYTNFFLPPPPSLTTRLLSRTIGVDRIVDELYVTFKHDVQIDWILPGIPPTGKYVEIAMVIIVAVKGGKLESEHVYWDQASVLVQVGLLDPKVVPGNMKIKGVKRLPAAGREGARLALNEESVTMNELIPDW
ncbi:dienelactone hydrolase-like protein [Patellaria atrata CBS 101060]|uniref:Dienelactone hydrolase-like protein n=1 Tax=Patellaria atrata CBS 101060 TaxID=1346257 RepID=A0A9P4SGQ9_9PEZI|nr:dienelactone hydrolase-like protein [Patellaria atrata CBS 101060]